jgi:plastocyanin
MPTRSRAPLRLGLAGALVALVLGIAVPTVLAASRGVAIADFAFSPRTIEIRVGDTVTWTNRDSVAHSATAQNGSFDTGLLSDGASGSVRFTAAGTYRYICTPHPDMTGTVVVRSASTGIVPPNTATISADDAPPAPADDLTLGLLAAIGGAAFLLAQRFLRRRQAAP